MPGGDRTGPLGMGPMTGRGAGFCAGNAVPGYCNTGFGRAMGRGPGWGAGRGRGWRNRFYAGYGPMALPPQAPMPTNVRGLEDEKQALELQAQQLQDAIDNIRRRIEAIESTKE